MPLPAIGAKPHISLSGLSSGLDTDSIIRDLMHLERQKVDKFAQARLRLEYKRDAYTDFNNTLRKMREQYFSVLATENNMLSPATFKNFSVDMATNASLAVTATANAKTGSHLVSIQQIAKGSTLETAKSSNRDTGITASEINNRSLFELYSAFADSNRVTIGGSGEFDVTINGTTVTLNNNWSMRKIMDTINQSDAGVTMSYSQLTDTFKLETNAMGAYDPVLGAIEMPDNASAATRRSIIEEYNQENGTNYTAEQWLENKGRTLTLEDTSGFFKMLGLSLDDDGKAEATNSQAAILTVNGTTITRNSNAFEIDGLRFSLTNSTEKADGTFETISFNVTRNTGEVVENIRKFVADLNTLLRDLYEKINEKRDRAFFPLTDLYKSEMTEKEIELWEAKAKAGILRRDPLAMKLYDTIINSLVDNIGGLGNLGSIGIDTGSFKFGEAVQIEIDTIALERALEEDPDRVASLFTMTGEGTNGAYANSGFANRVVDALDAFVNTTRDKNGPLNDLNSQIADANRRLEDKNKMLERMEQNYRRKYVAMERALSMMQSQNDAVGSLAMMFTQR